ACSHSLLRRNSLAADFEDGTLRLPRSRHRALLTAIVVLLGLFLARPGVQSLRAKIVRSISLALGRQVEVSHVRLRLLPQPGFDLENFVVHDDPSFSAEPLLRAGDVTASLRLISLLRGKLEIARLSLSAPRAGRFQSVRYRHT